MDGAQHQAPPVADGNVLQLAAMVPDLESPAEDRFTGDRAVRQVGRTRQRLTEAARLGFRRALVPMSAPDGDGDIVMERVATLTEAVDRALTGLRETGGGPAPARRERGGWAGGAAPARHGAVAPSGAV